MPFFSVVIPLYNKETFVAKTIESVLVQTFQDFEIIVVDDVSTDRSLEIASGFDKVKIVSHEKNKGLSASRNTGIANANSDFIAFIDADDVWKPYFLEKINEMIGKFPSAGLFASGYEECYPGNRIVEIHKNLDFAPDEMNIVSDAFAANSHQPMFCYSSIVIRKDVFDKVGNFDENITLGEDVDFNIRALQKFPLAYFNNGAAQYTIFSENQITTSAIGNKTVTDFNKYEADAKQNPSLKKYLDVNRYILAMHYKMARIIYKTAKLSDEIDKKKLTVSQRFLLSSPIWLVKLLKEIKGNLLQKGFRMTTFKK